VKLFASSLMALTLVALPSMVQAQGRVPTTDSAAVGGDVGLFMPRSDQLEPALSLDGFYEYYFDPRTSVRLGLGWSSPEFDSEPDSSLRHIRIGGDLIYNWEGGAIHPFAGAGLGIYLLQAREDGNDIGDSDAKLGGVLLGGFEFFTGRSTALKVEGSYHLISNREGFGPQNPDGLKLSVGLKQYF
jgi:Outer membrane protein beta-barrel domain